MYATSQPSSQSGHVFFFFLSLLHQALIFNAFSLQRDLIFESWCSHLSKNVSFFCNINELVSHSHECQQHYTSHIKSTNFSLFDAEQKKIQCKHDINVLTLFTYSLANEKPNEKLKYWMKFSVHHNEEASGRPERKFRKWKTKQQKTNFFVCSVFSAWNYCVFFTARMSVFTSS